MLRVAVLINLAPRKLGTFELWLAALAAEARLRGHRMDVFGHEPVHPVIAGQLRDLGAGWNRIAQLERHPFASVRRLARDYDVLHLNLFGPRARTSLIAYAAWPARTLFVNRHSMIEPGVIRAASARRLLDRISLARVAGVASISRFVKAWTDERYALKPAESRVIYNGIDVERFTPPPATRAANGKVRVLAAAFLRPDKGMHHAVGAFALLRDSSATLQIAGDGPEQSRLIDRARSLGIQDRVEFLGLRNDLPQLLNGAHIFVHPVVSQEAFGNTLAEAMASGCAVIASRVGAIPEIIEDGVSGLLVDAGDETGIASALNRLILDSGERDRLGMNARKRVVERFSLARCVREHFDWCEDIAR
ncbi:MAG: glycosyltransferase family 4 protein [Anaerolineae bacterium]|nr:glycosyltransferase family 4 protein [Gemmatimonadaceae bacterium]